MKLIASAAIFTIDQSLAATLLLFGLILTDDHLLLLLDLAHELLANAQVLLVADLYARVVARLDASLFDLQQDRLSQH